MSTKNEFVVRLIGYVIGSSPIGEITDLLYEAIDALERKDVDIDELELPIELSFGHANTNFINLTIERDIGV